MNDLLLFNYLRRKKREWGRNSKAALTQAEVVEINAVLKARDAAETPSSTPAPPTSLSPSSGAQAQPVRLPSRGAALAAIVGSVAATSLFASIPEDEGYRLAAYRDVAGIATVCFGDTKNVRMGMRETPEGCMRRLESQLLAHAKPVMACTPRLNEPGRDWQRAAAVSLAYNIGVGAWCRSSIDKRFDAGDWRGGCDRFLAWSKARIRGQLRTVTGLLNRRKRERIICLRGVA